MKKNGWKGFCKKLYKYRVFLLMLAPAVIYTLIFSYYPMTGIVMAFKKYSYAGGIWGSRGTDLITSSSSLNQDRPDSLPEIPCCIIWHLL